MAKAAKGRKSKTTKARKRGIRNPGEAKVLCYVRVSGVEQKTHGTSLADQEKRLVDYGSSVLEDPEPWVYSEQASGADDDRVELAALRRDVRPCDTVIVTRVDRWSRDIVHAVRSVRELVAQGVGWRAIDDNIDATTAQGDSHLGIMSWAADSERQRIRERMVGARKRLRDDGYQIEGLTPVGYRRDPENVRSLQVVEHEAAWVREAFKLCTEKKSLRTIAARMRELTNAHAIKRLVSENGLTREDAAKAVEESLRREPRRGRSRKEREADVIRHRWDHASLHRVLTNRLYTGRVSSSANLYEGKRVRSRQALPGGSGQRRWVKGLHVAIIDDATFANAQEALTARRNKKDHSSSRTNEWLMRGLAKCGLCGSTMGAAYARSRQNDPVDYYACNRRLRAGQDKRVTKCSMPYRRVEWFDDAARELLIEELEEAARDLAKVPDPRPEPRTDTGPKRTKLDQRLRNFERMHADGELSLDHFRDHKKTIDAELRKLDAIDAQHPEPVDVPEDVRRALAGLAKGHATLLPSMPVPEQRRVLAAWAKEIRIHADDTVEIEWRGMPITASWSETASGYEVRFPLTSALKKR